ncbi:MAG: sugar-transfer associated ATP-grasp domain-containing protein [Patescibacteria group bacterium]|nr:sugar-transfer associated ATP-grasp domain-containing protein [Patescibacteria group bacterium]
MILNSLKKSSDVLGMNSRNLDYIRPYNKRRARKIADNKLLTKKILRRNNIRTPRLISRVSNIAQLKTFDWDGLPNSFALKPNHGLGGGGIIVIYGKKKNGNWVRADRQEVSVQDLKNHIVNILDGNYSLAGTPDTAFFEERVKILKLFKPYGFRGIPDIRVIVFNNVPIMAMLRLPTEESGGRANLHLGGICVGIDLATGITTTAITRNLATQKEFLIDYVPNTRLSLSGVTIPGWKEILEISVKTQQLTSIGYLGVDIMIDRERGPVVAELNARPGLGIQIANLAPLKSRLQKVAGLKIKSVARGVRVGQDLFGGEIEEDIEDMTGKKVLGIFENVIIANPHSNLSEEVEAKIDTGAYSSSISSDLAIKLGYEKIVKKFNNVDHNNGSTKSDSFHSPLLASVVSVYSAHGKTIRPKVVIKLTLGGVTFETLATIAERVDLKYRVLIGRRDSRKFIVDPSKIKSNTTSMTNRF